MKSIFFVFVSFFVFGSFAQATLIRDMSPEQARKTILEISKSEVALRFIKDDFCRLSIQGIQSSHEIVISLADVVRLTENLLKIDDREFNRWALGESRRQLEVAKNSLEKEYEGAIRRCGDLDLR